MAGLICSHSVSLSLVTVIKSDPKNTPVTPSTLKILFASGDLSEFALEGKSAVPFCKTVCPGRNFRVAGFGVDSVCMNILISPVNSLLCNKV
jgi:hypothetical protein